MKVHSDIIAIIKKKKQTYYIDRNNIYKSMDYNISICCNSKSFQDHDNRSIKLLNSWYKLDTS